MAYFLLFLLYSVLSLLSVVLAEVGGYLIHTAIHLPPSWFEKHRWALPIKWVTTSHMGHHGLGYGVRMVQRPSSKYFFIRNPSHEKTVRFGFLLPEFTVFAVPYVGGIVLFLWLVGFTWFDIAFTMGMSMVWTAFSFLYVHDAFHKENHWLSRLPGVRRWFLKMRAAHDRHHTVMSHGEVPFNMGISLPFMDMLCGTWIGEDVKLVQVSEDIGQVLDTKFSSADYKRFHDLYEIEEPAFDRYVDGDIRQRLEPYRPSRDREILYPQEEK